MSELSEKDVPKLAGLSPAAKRELLAKLLAQRSASEASTRPPRRSFFEQAKLTPDAEAVRTEAGACSYAELADRARRWREALGAVGAGSELRAGICSPLTVEVLGALLGALEVNLTLVLLNASSGLSERLEASDVSWLIAHEDATAGVALPAGVTRIDPGDANFALPQNGNAKVADQASRRASLVFSETKELVEVEGGELDRFVDRLCGVLPSPPNFLLGQSASLMDPIVAGATLAVLTSGGRVMLNHSVERSASNLESLVRDQSITVARLDSADLAAFGAHHESGTWNPIRLDVALTTPDIAGAFSNQGLINGRILEIYARAEALAGAVIQEVREGRRTPVAGQASDIAVVDKRLRPVPPDVVGEICFVPREVGRSGSPLLRSGDLGRRRGDASLEITGHRGRRILRDGMRIDLAAVETKLLGQDLITDARVISRRTRWGAVQLVGYVVSSGGEEELRTVERSVSEAGLSLVAVSALPLTAGGEVDEEQLAALPVLTPEQLRRWEEELNARPEIEQAAVVLRAASVPARRRHLWDLLGREASNGAEPELPPTSGTETEEDANLPLALSDGGELQLPVDCPRTLPEALARTARENGDKGLRFWDGEGEETFLRYAELHAAAGRVAGALRAAGHEAGQALILQLPQLADHFTVFWGAVLAGLRPVTIAIAPNYEADNAVVAKLRHTWQLLESPAVVTDESLREAFVTLGARPEFAGLRTLLVADLRAYTEPLPTRTVDPEEIAFYQLTSGSTGAPKCIAETHAGVIRHIHGSAQAAGLENGDVSLNWLPVDHVVPILTYHLKDTYLGCDQVQVPTAAVLAEPLRWLEAMERYGVTHSWAPNFGFKLLSQSVAQAGGKRWQLGRVKRLMNAGEQVTSAVMREFVERLEPHGLGRETIQPAFGMAEVCTCMTYQNGLDWEGGVHEVRGGRRVGVGTEGRGLMDLGPPIPGVQIRITDAANEVQPEGKIGRLQIRGGVLTPGYHRNAAANEEAFVGDGWFNTGDLGFIWAGRLTVTGREKEQIVINGANYHCHEIEGVVGEVPGVRPTYVAACGMEESRSGTEGLSVFYTSAAGGANGHATAAAIRREVNEKIGLNPTHIVALEAEDFPKTTSGKIQRGQLKKGLAAGAYDEQIREQDLAAGNERTLPDWFHRPVWRRRRAERRSEPGAPANLILADTGGLGEALAQRLRAQGQRVTLARAGDRYEETAPGEYTLRPTERANHRSLLEACVASRLRIIHCWNCDPATTADFPALLGLLQSLASVDQNIDSELIVVGSGMAAPLDSEVIDSEKAPLLGLLRAARHEFPQLRIRHVDVVSTDIEAQAKRLVFELVQASGQLEVAWRDDERWVRSFERLEWPDTSVDESPIQHGGFYVVTGGLGDLGAAVCEWLLDDHECSVLIVGRSPLPAANSPASDQRRAAWDRLTSLNGRLRYACADVTNRDKLQKAVQEARDEWQRDPDGVFHLAGRYRECPIAEEAGEEFGETLAVKTCGAVHLRELLLDRPESLFVSFSSIYAHMGGFGLGSYAAANAGLDGFSQRLRSTSLIRSYSIAWSVWDGMGMSRGLQAEARLRELGYHTLDRRQGMVSLQALLRREPGEFLVGLDDSVARIRSLCHEPPTPLRQPAAFVAVNAEDATATPGVSGQDDFGARLECPVAAIAEMPTHGDGEIDRARLCRADFRQLNSSGSGIPPRNETEAAIAEIWRELLGVSSIGVHDNFFQLGGHSLMATQLIARLRSITGVEVPIQRLFTTPSVAGLAEFVCACEPAGEDVNDVIARRHRADAPVSYAQSRLWFLHRLDRGSAAYNIPDLRRLIGTWRQPAFAQAIAEIIRRHESLRTVFEEREGTPVQVIGPVPSTAVRSVDLSALCDGDRQAMARALAVKATMRPFDLSRGPLLQNLVFRIRPDEHVWLNVMHHIICDVWSLGVWFREQSSLYAGFVGGEPSSLETLPIQYTDFAFWQAERLQGDLRERQLSYWKEQLADAPTLIDLPTDRPRPAVQTFTGAVASFEIGSELTRELRRLSSAQDATLFMTLLAAYSALLHRCSRQDDIVIGSPIANRQREEVEPLIGFFANTQVLRTRLAGNPTFADLLAQAKQTCLEAYEHQDLPFELLVDSLRLERHLDRNPLFQTLFVLQNAPWSPPELPGLRQAVEQATPVTTVRLDLELHLWEVGNSLHGHFVYNTNLFDAATLDSLAQSFQALLAAIARSPLKRLHEISLAAQWDWPESVLGDAGASAQSDRGPAEPDQVALVLESEDGGEVHLTFEALVANERAAGALPEPLQRMAGTTQSPTAFDPAANDALKNLLTTREGDGILCLLPWDHPRLAAIAVQTWGRGGRVLVGAERGLGRHDADVFARHRIALAHATTNRFCERVFGRELPSCFGGAVLYGPPERLPADLTTGDRPGEFVWLRHWEGANAGIVFDRMADGDRSGQPIGRLAVLDEEGKQLPPCIVGEIHIEGYATGEHARRLPDGRVILNGRLQRQVWVDDRAVDLPDLEAVLLGNPGIEQARIMGRRTKSGIIDLVGYVVSSGGEEELRAAERRVSEAGVSLVAVSALPLTAGGEVDEEQLAALPVLTPEQLRRWEEELNARPEIEQVAVVLREATVPTRRRHLWDLLGREASNGAEPELPPTPGTETDEDANLPPALSDGGELQLPPDCPKTLPEALARTARENGDKGLRFWDGEREETFLRYAELHAAAGRVAGALRAAGHEAGQALILQLPQLADHFTVFWGAVLAGLRPVTIAIAPNYEADNAVVAKLRHTWQLLESPAVVIDESLLEAFVTLGSRPEFAGLRTLLVEDLRAYTEPLPTRTVDPEEIAFYQLTSGSTGAPKCIAETHAGVIRHIHGSAQAAGLENGDVSLNWLPVDHVVPILTYHLKDTYLGCDQVQVPTAAVLAEPLRWLEAMERYGVTHSWAPNFGFKLLSQSVAQAGGKRWQLGRVKRLMNAGEQVTAAVMREFVERLEPHGLGRETIQPAFGMAEVCTCMTYQNGLDWEGGVHEVRGGRRVGAGAEGRGLMDLGPPIPGVQIRITDAANKVEPEGKIGRLQIRGGVLTPGYHRNAAANEEAFVGDGWFNTGDLGFIWAGRLTVTGREKEQIVINGANYHCHEIEGVVGEVPGVRPTYVAACGMEESRSGTEGLSVFYTPVAGGANGHATAAAIRREVNEKIGLNPTHIVALEAEDFPKTTSGKIQRGQLKKGLAAGAYDEQIREQDLAAGNERTLPDWFHRPVWRRRRAERRSEPGAPANLILADTGGLGEALARRLKAKGQRVTLARAGSRYEETAPGEYTLRPTEREDHRNLLEACVAPRLRIIHCWNCDPAAATNPAIGFPSLLALSQALDDSRSIDDETHLLAAASGCYAGSSFAEEKAPLPGLSKTIQQEGVATSCRLVDIEHLDPAVDVERMLDELADSSAELEVKYSGRDRWVRRLEAVSWDRDVDPIVSDGGLYLITGGLGGVGSAVAGRLIEEFQISVVLVGRSNPDSVRKESYDKLRGAYGESVTYEVADVADAVALEAVVSRAEARSGQTLGGVFHLAGSMRQQLLRDETVAGFHNALAPKLGGSRAILGVLRRRPEAALIGFSSVNAFGGGVESAAYAAANGALESRLEQELRERSARIIYLAWSAWEGIGMNAAVSPRQRELAARKGFHSLPVRSALDCLIGVLRKPVYPGVLLGLDGDNAQYRSQVSGPVMSTAHPQICVARRNPADELPGVVQLQDRYGALVASEATMVDSMPVNDAGEIDYDRLPLVQTKHSDRQQRCRPPGNEIESRLAAIWKEVLGLSDLGVDEDFFALGGHSLLAVQLLARIAREFERELTLASLFEAPTIMAQAELLASPAARATWSPLVPLKGGGTKSPLFVTPPAGGTAYCYHELAGLLKADRPVYGLQARGIEAGQEPHEDMGEMADEYTAAIRELQPTGPYFLAGWSVGGLAAFEIARRLTAQGEAVALLALLEIDVSRMTPENFEIKDDAQVWCQMFGEHLELSEDELRGMDRSGQMEHIHRLALEAGLLPPEITRAQMERILRVFRSSARLVENYWSRAGSYPPYPGEAVLFQTEAGREASGYPAMGWLELAPNIQVRSAAGSHTDMIFAPHVKSLAADLQTAIEAAETRTLAASTETPS